MEVASLKVLGQVDPLSLPTTVLRALVEGLMEVEVAVVAMDCTHLKAMGQYMNQEQWGVEEELHPLEQLGLVEVSQGAFISMPCQHIHILFKSP